jgi:hypothetical protein
MITNYPITSNAILNFNTPRIAIFVNPTGKTLKINKRIQIGMKMEEKVIVAIQEVEGISEEVGDR